MRSTANLTRQSELLSTAYLRESSGAAPALDFASVIARQTVDYLVARGIKAILLDWDGCVMKLSKLHGQIAHEALKLCPNWCASGISLTDEICDAAYRGDQRLLGDWYRSLGGQGSPAFAPHGVPWDQLFESNIIRLALGALRVDQKETDAVCADFRKRIEEATQAMRGRDGVEKHLDPIRDAVPGALYFIKEAYRRGLRLHVVTMTPTSIVRFFSAGIGVADYISSFQGCDAFDAGHFPDAKRDPRLWREAATRQNELLSSCAIVEDNRANLSAAVASGVGAALSLSPEANAALAPDGRSNFFMLGSAGWENLTLVSPVACAEPFSWLDATLGRAARREMGSRQPVSMRSSIGALR